MKRKVIKRCPDTGRSIEVYEDLGPSRARPGHDSPGSSTKVAAAPLAARPVSGIFTGWARLG